jgi:hypothetical protein
MRPARAQVHQSAVAVEHRLGRARRHPEEADQASQASAAIDAHRRQSEPRDTREGFIVPKQCSTDSLIVGSSASYDRQ